MSNNNNRAQTSTQIRNFYSEGLSYLNVKFFVSNLSFSFYPLLSKDSNGISKYDLKNGQQTTVNYAGAYAIYKIASDIIDGKITECDLTVPCLAGELKLKRELGIDGKYQTVFSITKNNVTIPFKFKVIEVNTKVNGQPVVTYIEHDLGAFQKTIEGYLTGINADRHLDKLTEEYAALQQGQNVTQNNNQQGNNNQQNYGNNNYGNSNNNYRNNGYKKQYNGNNGNNGNNGYNKKQYNNTNNGYNNNGYQQGGNNNWNKQPNQQALSSYNIPN